MRDADKTAVMNSHRATCKAIAECATLASATGSRSNLEQLDTRIYDRDMCGRYTREYTWAQVREFSRALELILPEGDPQPAYNIAPAQSGWVLVTSAPGEATAHEMRWGIIPPWAKDAKVGYSTFNARVETASTKPAFRAAWKSRRCLIPASGYYEWTGIGKAKQAHYIHPEANPVLMFAGLWERWTPRDGEPIDSYTIVTMDAVDDMLQLHSRTPVMLSPGLLRDWIEADSGQAATIALTSPLPKLRWHTVDKVVGNVRNQGKELVAGV